MSSVNLVQPDSDYLKVTSERATKQELDKDAFMNLLITQMKYQDPLNPMDNQQMMAQLAQFSALEQMTNVAQTVEKQFANGMIGKHVSYQYTDSETGRTEYLVGKVDYVKINSGETLIGIGNQEIKVKDVKQVLDSSIIQANTSAFELIGKTVQGLIKEKDSQGVDEDVIVEGEVLSVIMKDDKPYLGIGTGHGLVEVDFNSIQNIVDKPSITGKRVTATIISEEIEKDEEGNETTTQKEKLIEGIAEYVKIRKDGTYVYINGQFVEFEKIQTITNK